MEVLTEPLRKSLHHLNAALQRPMFTFGLDLKDLLLILLGMFFFPQMSSSAFQTVDQI